MSDPRNPGNFKVGELLHSVTLDSMAGGKAEFIESVYAFELIGLPDQDREGRFALLNSEYISDNTRTYMHSLEFMRRCRGGEYVRLAYARRRERMASP